MFKKVFDGILIVGFILIFSNLAFAYPRATNDAKRWQFDFLPHDLSFYYDSQTESSYWVMIYEVTNNTGGDRQWVPNMELVTDKGEIIVDGKDVPRSVKLQLLDVYGDKLLKLQSDATGKFLQGEENAIKGLVVWKAGHKTIKEVQVFIDGVSGDTADVIHPITGKTHKLHRVIQLSWKVNKPMDMIQLKPLPVRPVIGGVSTHRLAVTNKDSIEGEESTQKWIFR